MVKRIKRQRFESWWQAKRYQWAEGSFFTLSLGFGTNERKARIYRAVEARYQRDIDRGGGFQPWHATRTHRQYRLKRRTWK